MKKSLLICAAGLMWLTACDDYLETSSPSVVDATFIFSNMTTARSVMDGAYENWRGACENQIYGCGLFYATDMAGSDMDTHPENYDKQPGRHIVEALFRNGTAAGTYGLDSYSKVKGAYESIYEIAGKVNSIITSMEGMKEDYSKFVENATEPSDFGQLYGEAIALRATVFREALRQFGDLPISFEMGVPGIGFTNRDAIYDHLIDDLKRVEPVMYDLGANPKFGGANKNYFSRTYVTGLIGRLCLDAAGYQTRRGDIVYTDGEGNLLQFEKIGIENNGATYGRRSDWKKYYETARKYFELCLAHTGTAVFHSTDPRANSDRLYNNPYQYFFQQMHDSDTGYADESIYEYPMQYATADNSRGYDLGRASDGASNNAYPCKVYSQCRAVPAFYYGMYDPDDMRRDVTYSVTGSSGKGTEQLVSFAKGSKLLGGITLNKWDPNRQPVPWTQAQRKSGINGPYMRLSEIYLGYAEVCAVLGDNATAKQYLTLIRERSFPEGKANVDAFISENGGLLKAIIQERAFELGGDGDRRWTLIRTGLLPEKIKEVKDLTRAMLDGLKADGYFTFKNGNVISNYIWTKMVDAKTEYGYRLTTQCPESKKDDPVLYPSWRGQHDSWDALGMNYDSDKPKTNLAIKGLFNYIDPDSEEAKALEADGYTKVAWGAELIDNKSITSYDMEYEYYTTFFYDYDYNKAPLYLYPLPTAILTAGSLTNGYGYRNIN